MSVPTLLRTTVDIAHHLPALRTRDETGQLRDWTYGQYHEDVRLVARAFISLGLEPLHTVAVLGHPHPCQHIANMASIHAGGFVGGMYLTNTEEACQYIAEDSRANIIVVSDQTQLEKILAIRSLYPVFQSFITHSLPGPSFPN